MFIINCDIAALNSIFANFIELMKDDLTANLNALNEAQRAPTLHKDGPLIVIAGAGSGKLGCLRIALPI